MTEYVYLCMYIIVLLYLLYSTNKYILFFETLSDM